MVPVIGLKVSGCLVGSYIHQAWPLCQGPAELGGLSWGAREALGSIHIQSSMAVGS